MAQPTANEGSRQMGMVQVETAMQMLEQACATLGTGTKEYTAAEKALGALSKVFNRSKAKELVPAQIAEMARAQQQSPIAPLMSGGAPQGAPASMVA
jgi:hypothetical protein